MEFSIEPNKSLVKEFYAGKYFVIGIYDSFDFANRVYLMFRNALDTNISLKKICDNFFIFRIDRELFYKGVELAFYFEGFLKGEFRADEGRILCKQRAKRWIEGIRVDSFYGKVCDRDSTVYTLGKDLEDLLRDIFGEDQTGFYEAFDRSKVLRNSVKITKLKNMERTLDITRN